MNQISKETWGWWGIELPGRGATATYRFWPYDCIPKIEIKQEYKDITNIDQLTDFIQNSTDTALFYSPTAYELNRNATTKPAVSYSDRQKCILWCLDEKGRVITDSDILVAETLPEFLTRVEIEGSIWLKTNITRDKLTLEEEKYLDFYPDHKQIYPKQHEKDDISDSGTSDW